MNKFFLKKIFKKISFIGFLFLIMTLKVNAQDNEKIAWVKNFRKAGDGTQVAAIASDSYNNTIVLLNANKFSPDDSKKKLQYSYIILRNKNGKKEWRVPLNNKNNTKVIGQNLSIDNNGNIYVLGIIEQSNNRKNFIAKYDSQGKKLWDKILGDVDNKTSLQKILVDELENIYVLGTSLAEEINVVLYKFDFDGNNLFEKKYTHLGFGKNSVERTIIAKIDKNQNIYIAGQTESLLRSSFLLKVSIHGNLLFKEFICIADSELFLSSLDFDEQENIYLGGGIRIKFDETVALYQGNEILNIKKYSLSSGSKDYFILKFNAKEKKKEWIRTYGSHKHINSIHDLKLYENQIFVVGSSSENLNKNRESNEQHHIFIKRFDLNGTQRWVYSLPYNFMGDMTSYRKLKLTVDSEGSLIIGGAVQFSFSEVQKSGENDYGALIKITNNKKVTNNLHPLINNHLP